VSLHPEPSRVAIGGGTPLRFERADAADVSAIAALLADAARALTVRHGDGPWSRSPTERSVLAGMRGGSEVWGAYAGRALVATWALGRRKPWAIDLRYFSAEPRTPRYLTDMAVVPSLQGQGIGKRCLEHVVEIARGAGADAVRLDAYAAAAGAAGFYSACGFREVGRADYRGTPHVYFELLLLNVRAPGHGRPSP